MARKKHYNTYQDLLQHFLALYYSKREETPGIKANKPEHKKLVDKVNKEYLRTLHKHHPDWETEETQRQFIREIEFLTGPLEQPKKKSLLSQFM